MSEKLTSPVRFVIAAIALIHFATAETPLRDPPTLPAGVSAFLPRAIALAPLGLLQSQATGHSGGHPGVRFSGRCGDPRFSLAGGPPAFRSRSRLLVPVLLPQPSVVKERQREGRETGGRVHLLEEKVSESKSSSHPQMADEVDEGQAAGLIAEREGSVRNPDSKTFAELGLKKQRLAEARRIRDHYTGFPNIGTTDGASCSPNARYRRSPSGAHSSKTQCSGPVRNPPLTRAPGSN